MIDDDDAARDGLRGASDGLLLAIEEVGLRERRKRGVHPTDPGFVGLARDVRVAAEAVLELARDEEAEASVIAGHGGPPLPTIEATPEPADLAVILAEWREVERRLAAADPTSPEAARLIEQFEVQRDRYARALKTYRR